MLCAQSNTETNPTASEQLAIYEINRARANPSSYDSEKGLGGVLNSITPAPALALNKRLVTSSRFHSDEMASYGYFAHQSQVTGQHPNQMVRNAGYPLKSTFPNNQNNLESLAAIAGTTNYPPANAIENLIEDAGVNPPGHRYHLLAWGGSQSQIDFNRAFREIGIGFATGLGYNGSSSGAYWSIHTGVRDSASDNPWITGVVYDDTNSNGRYDSGEGMSGVTVTCEQGTQSFNFTTSAGGGYSFEVSSGDWILGCSGGSFSGQRWARVTVGSENMSVDFRSDTMDVDINFGNWGNLPGSAKVDGSGIAPTITSTAKTTATAGYAYSYTLTDDGLPAASYSASGLPSWLSLQGSTLAGTPSSADIGTTGTIIVTADNGVGSDTQSFQITVTAGGGGGGGGGTGGGGGSTSTGSSTGGVDYPQSNGCAAGMAGIPWLLALLGLAAVRRRRRE